MRLISIREIRTEQTSDNITVTAEGMGRSGRKSLPFPGSRRWLTAVQYAENQWSCSLKFKIHQRNSNKSKPEAGYFAKGLKESFRIGTNGSTGKLMWKLPRKRTCSSNESFVSTTSVRYQQIGKPKCRHTACAGRGEVLSAEPLGSTFSWKCRKAGKLSPARILLAEVNCSRSLKSSSGRELQG